MNKLVFIVDDSDTNLTVAAAALEEEYRVMTIPSAQKMFTVLERKTPELILLDIEMPDMDGYEAGEKLKGNPAWAGIPLIFVTGHVDDAVLSRAQGFGALCVIKKPFDPSELLLKVNGYMNATEAQATTD